MVAGMRAEVLGVVPARGGSKSIPRKNARLLGGHPLLAYSIAAGLGACSVTRLIVSTDNPELAEIAKQYGAEVPFLRPAELAGDDTPDLPVFQHALDFLKEKNPMSRMWWYSFDRRRHYDQSILLIAQSRNYCRIPPLTACAG